MSQIFTHINATIVSTERKTSSKGNEYLKVVVKDEFRNQISLCDMDPSKEYKVNSKGDLLLKITQNQKFTNLSIEEFTEN